MKLNDEKYVAIIGDIVGSKKIKNRQDIQKQFKAVLSEVNKRFTTDIASEFMITLGDEFQGLLKSRQNVMKIVREIEMAMTPVELRFGIGVGEVSTMIDFKNTLEMDGPAYHRARAMMDTMHEMKTQYSVRQTNIMIASGDDNREIDELMNATLSVCSALKSKWTDRQKEIVHHYLTHDENQYKTATALDIGQSSVNKALKSTRFYSYKAAMDVIEKFLSENRGESHA